MNIIKNTLLSLSTFVVLLGGCENARVNDNHGYGWGYDTESPMGVHIRDSSQTFTPSVEEIDRLYVKVKTCVGVSFDVTPLLILQDYPPEESPSFNGITYFDSYLIIINAANADWYTYQLLNHELIHVFLAASGIEDSKNHNHKSPLFATCMY